MNVLIAEDEIISRKMLKRNLENWGHTVFEAANGREALQIIEKQDIALVITDWMMPDLDGLSLVKTIRSMPSQDYIYIIMVTARNMKQDLIEGMEAGADDFMSKPFDREELRVRLRAGERIIRLERTLWERNRALEEVTGRLQKDLQAAARIQQSLLPRNLPTISGLNVAWKFRPCDELAGDTLNIFPLGPDRLAMYLVDVSGHGVPAALTAVALTQLMKPQVASLDGNVEAIRHEQDLLLNPARLAEHLNQRFQVEADQEQFFTLLFGLFEVNEGVFRYVSAGAPELLYLPKGQTARTVPAPGLPIGFLTEVNYPEKTLALQPGDRMILYSDGIPEARNEEGELFGLPRMIEVLERERHRELGEALEALLSAAVQWSQKRGIEDDMTLLALEYLG